MQIHKVSCCLFRILPEHRCSLLNTLDYVMSAEVFLNLTIDCAKVILLVPGSISVNASSLPG